MKTFTIVARWGLSLWTLVAATNLLAQGPLTPPGVPGPTFKTLDQIEPRIPIESLPAGGGARHQITQPGSYYLSSNMIAAAGQDGIFIQTNNVTVDLNGYTMFGVSNRAALKVSLPATINLRVRNGRLSDWSSGVNFSSISNAVIEDLEVRCLLGGSFRNGIAGWNGSVVRRCVVTGVTGNSSVGINVASWSAVEACQVSECQRGISVESGCRVEGCAVRNCFADAIFGVSECILRNNYAERCNGGIRVSDRSVVTDNLVVYTSANGFYAAGSHNRFERNAAHFNRYGFQTVSDSTNFVVQSVAHGNTNQNYNFLGNVVAGPTVTTIGVVTNHPWANFSY